MYVCTLYIYMYCLINIMMLLCYLRMLLCYPTCTVHTCFIQYCVNAVALNIHHTYIVQCSFIHRQVSPLFYSLWASCLRMSRPSPASFRASRMWRQHSACTWQLGRPSLEVETPVYNEPVSLGHFDRMGNHSYFMG